MNPWGDKTMSVHGKGSGNPYGFPKYAPSPRPTATPLPWGEGFSETLSFQERVGALATG